GKGSVWHQPLAAVEHRGSGPVHSTAVGPASALPAGERPWGSGSSGSVITLGVMRLGGAEVRGSILGRWRNGSKRPVLKHGPRSLTSMRVFGCQARPRNTFRRFCTSLRDPFVS